MAICISIVVNLVVPSNRFQEIALYNCSQARQVYFIGTDVENRLRYVDIIKQLCSNKLYPRCLRQSLPERIYMTVLRNHRPTSTLSHFFQDISKATHLKISIIFWVNVTYKYAEIDVLN